MSAIIRLLFTDTWWTYHPDGDWFTHVYSWFNVVEGWFWLLNPLAAVARPASFLSRDKGVLTHDNFCGPSPSL